MIAVVVGSDHVVKVPRVGREDGVEVGDDLSEPFIGFSPVNEDRCPIGSDDQLARTLADIDTMDLKLLSMGQRRGDQSYEPPYEKDFEKFLHVGTLMLSG